MSREIDEKVVEIRFDNRDFERNVRTSMSTLDKLKASMQFKGADKGFESVRTAAMKVQDGLGETASAVDKLKQSLQLKGGTAGIEAVQSAAQKCDLSPLGDAVDDVQIKFSTLGTTVDNVRVKFSALEVMAVTALTNITNQAVNTGKRIVSAFTIDPVKTGFQEYETQINAVQTILANTESKGSTLQNVNKALAELNTYADKTIYNFTEMTRNIGTFTAAGVDLKTSVSAIKGIANLAAVSGSTSQQASVAMYQLSQALASGTVKLMDWNSVVNAGMGGQVFQDSLKETARIHKINIDAMIKKEGSFRETLKDGWLTSEILTETLAKFTGDLSEQQLKAMGYTEQQIAGIIKMGKTANDAATKVKTFTQLFDTLKEASQSGWTKTWEIIVGDFGEAKEFLTEISDMVGGIIGATSDARNNLLAGTLSTGWKQLLNEGIHDTAGFQEMMTNVAKDRGVDFDKMIKTESIAKFTKELKSMSEEELKNAGYTREQVKELTKLNKSVQSGAITLDEYSEAAKQQGADYKSMLDGSVEFIDVLKKSFKDGKVESDLISESVTKFTEKINGMSDAEIEAAGYTKDQINKLNELNEKFKDGTLSAEEFAKKIVRPSGRELLIESLRNAVAGLGTVFEPIKDAFKAIFPKADTERIYSMIESFRDWTATLKLSDENAKKVKETFKGIFSILSIGVTVFKKVISGAATLAKSIFGLGDGFITITASIGKGIDGIRKFIEKSDLIGTVVGGITKTLKAAVDVASDFMTLLGQRIQMPGLSGLSDLFDGVANSMKSIVGMTKKLGKNIVEHFSEAFSGGELSAEVESWIGVFNSTIVGGILLSIKNFLDGFKDIGSSFAGIGESLKETLGGVKDILKAMALEINAKALLKIAFAVGILAASVLVLSTISVKKTAAGLVAVFILFKTVINAVDKLKVDGMIKGLFGVAKVTTAMISLATSVLILAFAVKKLGSLNVKELATGLAGVIVLTQVMVRAIKSLAASGKGATKGATQMVIMAAALKILASACADLAKLSWNQLAKGVAGIGVVLLEFAGFQKLMSKIDAKKMFSSATSLVIMGVAMEIFANVCSKFGKIGWESLGKSGAAITGILGLAAGFGALAKYTKKVIGGSMALVVIGGAMEIFAHVCSKFGSMKWTELGKAGTAITGILGLAIGFGVLAKFTPSMTKAVTGLILMSAAMEIFADICNKFGSMEWEELGKAGAAITGILGLAIGFGVLAKFAPSMLKASAALLVMAAAMSIFAPIIKSFGNMSVGGMIKSLVMLAGVFTVLGLAAHFLTPVIPAMYSLSGAIAVLGAACLMIGVGTMAFAAGLAGMATSAVAGAVAIVSALEIIITGIIGLIPATAKALAGWITAFCDIIISCSSSIGAALKTVVLVLVDVLVQCIPQITNGCLQLVLGVLTGLAQYAPQIVEQLFNFVVGIINSFASKMPELVQACVNVLTSLFQGVVDALSSMDPEVLIKGIGAIGVITAMMAALAACALLTPAAMIGVVGVVAVLAELGALAQIPGLEWLIGEGAGLLQKIGTAIGGFVGGLVGGFGEGLSGSLPAIADNLSSFMGKLGPFLTGVSSIDESMLSNIQTLAAAMLVLTGASLLESIASFLTGGASLTSFGEQLEAFGPSLSAFGTSVSTITPETLTAAADATKNLALALKAIPFDWNHNEMTKFGEQLESFGPSLATFDKKVAGITPEKLTAAADATKTLASALNSIPFDWGHNELSSFGEQLESYGSKLSALSKEAKNVNSKNIDKVVSATKKLSELKMPDNYALTNLSSSISSLVSSLKGMSVLDSTVIESFNSALASLGTTGIESFVKAFTDGKESVKTAANGILKAVITVMNNAKTATSETYLSFYSAGSYLVDGFALGMTNNKYKSTAAGKAIAKAAYEAAMEELDSHSPSRKFIKIGKYVVDGFAKGMSKYKAATDASRDMGNAVLEATQDELGIHSPSIVFDKKVGRYIVQGIAEGITKDMSAEEAAKKKADNIVSAFKKELDKIDLEGEIETNEFDLWKLGEGKNASDERLYAENKRFLTNEWRRAQQYQDMTWYSLQETEAYYKKGQVTYEAVRQAHNEYVKAQKETLTAQQNLNDLEVDYKTKGYDDVIEDNEKAIEIRERLQELWLKTDGKHLSDAEKEARLLKDSEDTLKNLEKAYTVEQSKHETLINLRETAEDQEEIDEQIYESWKKCREFEEKIADEKAYIIEIQNAAAERELEALETRMNLRDKELELAKAQLGNDATDDELYKLDRTNLVDDLEDLNDQLKIEKEQWLDVKLKYKEGKATLDEVNKEYEEYLDAKTSVVRTENDISQLDEDAAKRELEALQKQYDLAVSNADLRYQIWEKTTGRKATGAEKDAQKLSMLSNQLLAQSSSLNLARREWNDAVNEYGKSSNEAQEAYNNYLQKQLDVANIQNEISDINDKAVTRQKAAASEYKDYIDKYEKFYLMNGMTRDELEKDAKLVSGYNPDKTVRSMVTNTSSALTSVQNSTEYSNLISRFTSMGTTYIDAVNEGVCENMPVMVSNLMTMLEECVDTMKEDVNIWNEAGVALMDGFIEGIKSRTQVAIDAVNTVADKISSTLSETLNTTVDTSSTISAVVQSSSGSSSSEKKRHPIEANRAGINISTVYINAAAASMNKSGGSDSSEGNGSNSKSGTTINYTQNNYSPKALSRSDIYRQTNSQLAGVKGALT